MKILIAGDFCPQDRVAEAFEHDKYEEVLGEVKPFLEGVDYSIVNFECAITKGGEKPITKIGPNLHCSEKGIEAIKWAGFNCVTLANNHFYDFGDESVDNTLTVCNKMEIDTVGGGRNIDEASQILYKQINEQTIAIINCCEHEFSIATETTAGSNPLNPIQQYYAIREAKSNADYVLVIVHGGLEHWQLPSPRMVETYRFFIDSGADAVVNHHQHCFSGYEVYKEKPIFYGIGNFCFDKPKFRNAMWNEGFLVKLEFGDYIGFEIIPCFQCSVEAKIIIQTVDQFKDRIIELNKTITNQEALKLEAKKKYAQGVNKYSKIFEPIRNKYYLVLRQKGWLPSFISKTRKLQAEDYICCEAHRDSIIDYLQRKE